MKIRVLLRLVQTIPQSMLLESLQLKAFFSQSISNFILINRSGDNKLLMFRVYVHEPSLVELVKNSLQRRDRVFVNGFLNYKSEMDKSGVKKRNGYIEAKNIFKVDRFNTERFNEAPNEEAVAARE